MAKWRDVRAYWKAVSKEAARRAFQTALGDSAKAVISVLTMLVTAGIGWELAGPGHTSSVQRFMGSVIALSVVIGIVCLAFLLIIPSEKHQSLATENATLRGRRSNRDRLNIILSVANDARRLNTDPNFTQLDWLRRVLEWRTQAITRLSEINERDCLEALAAIPSRDRTRAAGNPTAETQQGLLLFVRRIEAREAELESQIRSEAQSE
jgi:hypothetical protein